MVKGNETGYTSIEFEVPLGPFGNREEAYEFVQKSINASLGSVFETCFETNCAGSKMPDIISERDKPRRLALNRKPYKNFQNSAPFDENGDVSELGISAKYFGGNLSVELVIGEMRFQNERTAFVRLLMPSKEVGTIEEEIGSYEYRKDLDAEPCAGKPLAEMLFDALGSGQLAGAGKISNLKIEKRDTEAVVFSFSQNYDADDFKRRLAVNEELEEMQRVSEIEAAVEWMRSHENEIGAPNFPASLPGPSLKGKGALDFAIQKLNESVALKGHEIWIDSSLLVREFHKDTLEQEIIGCAGLASNGADGSFLVSVEINPEHEFPLSRNLEPGEKDLSRSEKLFRCLKKFEEMAQVQQADAEKDRRPEPPGVRIWDARKMNFTEARVLTGRLPREMLNMR